MMSGEVERGLHISDIMSRYWSLYLIMSDNIISNRTIFINDVGYAYDVMGST